MPSKAKLIQEGLNVLEALAKDSGLLREAVERHLGAPRDEALKIAQRNAAKPVSKGGLGLPPNNTPMDRARALGAIDAYHGTASDVRQIDPAMRGSVTGAKSAKEAFWAVDDPRVASSYAENAATYAPVQKLIQQADAAEKVAHRTGNWDKYDSLVRQAEELESALYKQPANGQNIMPLMIIPRNKATMNAKGESFVGSENDINAFLRQSRAKGKDVAIIQNLDDAAGMVDVPATHYGVLNPSAVRSRFAAFDPARIDENDLLAGFAALGIAAPMLTSGDSEYAKGGSIDLESEFRGFAPYGLRHDSGMPKGKGWFGELRADDGVMTELSASDEGGDFPLIVPTLTRKELEYLQSGGEPTEEIYAKAKSWAETRKARGKDPFATREDPRFSVPGYADGGSPKYSTSQAIKDIVGGGLSNLESMARGSVAGLVGAPGDINELIRDTLGLNLFPELPAAPTSERILKAVPRITAPRKESEGMETLGAFVQPTDALVAAGRGVGMAAKAASPTAAKMAADFYEKAVESGMAVPAKLDVVKPKGGNWLVGGSQAPEGILKALVIDAAEDRPYINFVQEQNNRGDEFRNWILQQLEQNPEYRSTPGIEAANQFLASRGEPLLQGDPVNSWLKAKLPKYIKNEMGTPEDPIRLQADAWAEEQAGLLAQKDAQIANAVQKMEKARQARGLTPEEMTRSQEQIRQLRLEREFIAEQRGIHYNPDYLGVNRYRAPDVRNQAGYPKEGMGTSEAGRAWEAASDVSINPQWPYIEQLPMSNVAAKAKAYGKTEQEMLNEGLNYIGGQFAVKNPEALAYSINTGTSPGLGFNHLSDELRNATNPESGLPKELLLSAKDLEKMSVPQAVRHVDKINAFRAVQKAEVNAAIAGNAATHTLKEYPEAGKKWVELKVPEPDMTGLKSEYMPEVDMWRIVDQNLGVESSGATEREALGLLKRKEREKMLEDALKYEGEQLSHCVGGYCPDVIRGESRILSLRSDNGRPLATIELGKEQYPNKDLIGAIKKLGTNYADVADEAMRRVGIDPANQKAATEEQREAFQKAFDDIYKELGGTKTIEINQIKGRRNAPPKEHLNEVMDFLRDNPDAVFTEEGRRDLNGLGIVDLKEQAFGIPPGLPRFMTKEKFDRFQKTGKFEPDFKRGGIAKKKRYINVSLLEQEFRHKQKG